MRMASRYTRSPKVATSCSGRVRLPSRRSASTSAASPSVGLPPSIAALIRRLVQREVALQLATHCSMTAMSLVTFAIRIAPSSDATRKSAALGPARGARTRPGAASLQRRGSRPATRRRPRPAAAGTPRARRTAPRRGCPSGSRPRSCARAAPRARGRGSSGSARAGRRRIGEARLERALEERGDDLVEDRVAEVFLALEVVVEVPLPTPLSRRTSSSEVWL